MITTPTCWFEEKICSWDVKASNEAKKLQFQTDNPPKTNWDFRTYTIDDWLQLVAGLIAIYLIIEYSGNFLFKMKLHLDEQARTGIVKPFCNFPNVSSIVSRPGIRSRS